MSIRLQRKDQFCKISLMHAVVVEVESSHISVGNDKDDKRCRSRGHSFTQNIEFDGTHLHEISLLRLARAHVFLSFVYLNVFYKFP